MYTPRKAFNWAPKPGCSDNKSIKAVNKQRHGSATWGPVVWNQWGFQFGEFFFASKWGNHLWEATGEAGYENLAACGRQGFEKNPIHELLCLTAPMRFSLSIRPPAIHLRKHFRSYWSRADDSFAYVSLLSSLLCGIIFSPNAALRSQIWIIASSKCISSFTSTGRLLQHFTTPMRHRFC